jgi:hypothetical protein
VKKTYLVSGLLMLIVALAMGYFVGVPLAQIKQEKSLEAKHKQVNDKLAKVYDSFKRDVFTKAGTPSGTAKADVKVGLDAVKDARSELNADAPALTKFSALPLLDWNQTYHTAKSLDAREEQYIKDARAFLDQYDALLVYTDKSADLQAQIEAATKAGRNHRRQRYACPDWPPSLTLPPSKLQPLGGAGQDHHAPELPQGPQRSGARLWAASSSASSATLPPARSKLDLKQDHRRQQPSRSA